MYWGYVVTFSPDFIGIGARRCASSQVHRILLDHPQVVKGEGGAHYYSQNFEKGPEWLQSHVGVAGEGQITVELSVSYLYPEYYKAAADRIAQTAPAARLFVLLRNPVERAYSDWRRSIKMNEIPSDRSFIEACRENPEFIDRSRFYQLLSPYWEHFGREGVKIFLYETLVADRRRYFEDMADFFGIAVEPLLAPVRGSTGHAHGAKNKTVHTLLMSSKNAARSAARKLGVEGAWNAITRTFQPVYQKVLELNARELEMTEAERRFAYDLLKDDMEAFQEAIGRRLPDWAMDK